MKMDDTIKAIETFYDGYRFRSRLEARWAVFFHEAGIPYVYEPEGFKLYGDRYYLPDFYLPWFSAYVEIKPSYIEEGEKKEAKHKLDLLHFESGKVVMIFFGDPYDGDMNILIYENNHHAWDWRKFKFLEGAWYNKDISSKEKANRGYTKHYINISIIGNEDSIFQNTADGTYFDNDKDCYYFRSDLHNAAISARQARFEHGEVCK